MLNPIIKMWRCKYWCKILLIILILVWVSISFYTIGPLWKTNKDTDHLMEELIQANAEIEHLRKTIHELSPDKRASNIHIVNQQSLNNGNERVNELNSPSTEYEQTRRRLYRDINEYWWYIQGFLEPFSRNKDITASEIYSNISHQINKVLIEGRHRHDTLLSVLDDLSEADGYNRWRENEAIELSNLVQKRIYALQNPSDCSSAKKLVCNINKLCGFGCQIHHVVYCFILAYGTERTLVLTSKDWRYNRGGFEQVFKPVSETCSATSLENKQKQPWPWDSDAQIVDVPIIEYLNPKPEFLPPAIPEDLSDRIIRLHGDPVVWWISQFVKYLLRPQNSTAQFLSDLEVTNDLSNPIVGVHIRRTDKLEKEASLHEVDEYMRYVSEYFQQVETNTGAIVSPKRVYIASDDPGVFSEARKNYPRFEFLGDESRADSAKVQSRYNLKSLQGLIADIYMLSRSEYIVCTFSSQVCRLAYEIQQQLYSDGSWRFKSLDDVWYFGNSDHQQEVILPHNAATDEELNLEIGDVLSVAGNHWNGYNKGRKHGDEEQLGLYPLYKTKEKYKIVAFPTYPEVVL